MLIESKQTGYGTTGISCNGKKGTNSLHQDAETLTCRASVTQTCAGSRTPVTEEVPGVAHAGIPHRMRMRWAFTSPTRAGRDISWITLSLALRWVSASAVGDKSHYCVAYQVGLIIRTILRKVQHQGRDNVPAGVDAIKNTTGMRRVRTAHRTRADMLAHQIHRGRAGRVSSAFIPILHLSIRTASKNPANSGFGPVSTTIIPVLTVLNTRGISWKKHLTPRRETISFHIHLPGVARPAAAYYINKICTKTFRDFDIRVTLGHLFLK